MSDHKFYSYVTSALFVIYFLSEFQTPSGIRIIPYGHLIALGIIALVTIIALFKGVIFIQRGSVSILLMISILFLISLISSTWSPYPQLTLQRAFMSFLGLFGALIIVSVDENSKGTFKMISVILFLSVSIISLLGVMIFFFGHNSTINGTNVQILSIGSVEIVQNTVGPENRITSPFLQNPNTLAGLITISLPLSVYLLIVSRSLITVPGIGVQFLGLLLTFSRTGLVTTIVSFMVIFVLFLYEESRLMLVIKSFLLLLLPIGIILNYIPGVDRFTSLSIGTREITWAALYQAFTQNPFIGAGFGVSYEVVLSTMEDAATSAHSDYFAILAELGGIGVVLFLLLLTTSFLLGIKNYSHSNRKDRIYIGFVMAIFIALSVRGLVETVVIRPSFTQLFWSYLLALLINVHYLSDKTISNSSKSG